jgi:hypothetical protein
MFEQTGAMRGSFGLGELHRNPYFVLYRLIGPFTGNETIHGRNACEYRSGSRRLKQ